MSKTKLSCLDRSDWVPSVKKTKQDNDVIDHIGVVYAKTIQNFHNRSDQVSTKMKTR